MNPRPHPTCPRMAWLSIALCGGLLLSLPVLACAQPAVTETPPIQSVEPGQQAEPGQQIEPGPAMTPPAPTADGSAATPNTAPAAVPPAADAYSRLNVWELLEAGGTIGWLIVALSIAFLALLLEHILAVRHGTLCPRGLGGEVHRQIEQGHFPAALAACEKRPSFLAAVLAAGLAEVELGYSAVEKAMEDASQQQAARLYRKLEYFTMIGTITPMLGLLGTVWGMILAFMEFEAKANPSPSELAPGIYKALVTTLQGLCVAIPALAAYALLRNRTDELVAEASLAAEHAFSGFKRALHRRKVDPAEPRRVRRSEAAPDSTGAAE